MCAQVSWFTRSSRLPRPASPASTTKVETVHPQVELGNYVEKRNSRYVVLISFFDTSPTANFFSVDWVLRRYGVSILVCALDLSKRCHKYRQGSVEREIKPETHS